MKRTIASVLVAIMTILCIGGGYSESDALNDGIEAEEIILDQLPEPEQESEEDMATGDKLVNLDDLKVTYDKQQEDTNSLKSALTSFVEVELGTMTSGYVKYDDGSVQSNDSYTHTDYLELYGAKQLRIKGAFQYSAGIAFYDAYKFYISGINGTTMGELKHVTVPENAKYIRASKHNSYELIIEYAQLEKAISENKDKIKASDERDKNNSVYLGERYVLHPELFKNGINNGSPTKSNTRVLTDFIELYDHRIGININSGYQYTVSLFDSNKAYISGSETSWRTRNEEYLFSSATYIRILIAKSDATQSITKQEAEQNLMVFYPWYWNNIMTHDLTGKVPIQIKWEQGRIDENGDDESSSNGVRSRMIIANSENSIVQIIPDKINTNYCYKVVEYEYNQTTLKKLHEYSTSYYPFIVGSKYFRIEILDTSWSGQITPSVAEGKVEVSFIIENLLPDNYKTMIKDREGYVSTYSHRQGLNVLFITDTHMEELTNKHVSNMDTSLESFRSVVELANSLNVDLIVHGGDVIHGASANGKVDAFDAFKKTVEIFKDANCPVLFCRGNHDDNMYHSDNPSDYNNYVPVSRLISIEEWLVRLVDPMKVQITHDSQNINSSYYFYDFPLKKKRIIVLDPYDYPLIDKGDGYAQWVSESWNKFSDRQLAWFENEALGTVPAGYEPIVFLHGVLVDGTGETKVTNASAVRTILNTYNSSHTNKIYNVIYGHTHFDIYSYEDGINFFCTACGFVSHYSSTPTHTVEYYKNPEREKFTGTEMRFDVYSLKGHTSKRLKCGAGESQNIT